MLQVLLDQYGSLERAPRELALRIPICILWRSALLLFHTDQHFSEEEALELLPRLAVFADFHSPVKSQSPKSDIVNHRATRNEGELWSLNIPLKFQPMPIVYSDTQVFRNFRQDF